MPDPAAAGTHSRLRLDTVNDRVYQAREFDGDGYPVRDIDFTELDEIGAPMTLESTSGSAPPM